MSIRIRICPTAALFALTLAVVGCASQPADVRPGGPSPAPKMAAGSARLTDADSGEAVELTVGGELVVDLEENVTTGYSWRVDVTPGFLQVTANEQKVAAATGAVGAAGRHIVTWKATRAGTGEVVLTYLRPWEQGVPPAKKFTASVTVK
jgi:inhibitor of cysteine peptidase